MNRYFTLILTLLVAATTLTSCFKDDDDSSAYEGQSLITAATLGTLTRDAYFVNNNGVDTVISMSVTGSLYGLSIDQNAHHIFNADSLPAHTRLTKVMLKALTAQGTVGIRDTATGHDYAWTYTDSTDFSYPREITVYGNDGTSRTTYTMELRVHNEVADSMQWQELHLPGLPAELTHTRLLTRGDSLLLWGINDGDTHCYWLSRQKRNIWMGARTNNGPEPETIVAQNGTFFGLTATSIVSSTDGIAWQNLGARPTGMTTLAAASTRSLYALNGATFLRSTDGGHIFEADSTELDNALPASDIAAITYPTRSNAQVEEILLVGCTPAGATSVWKRNEMKKAEQEDVATFTWNYINTDPSNHYAIPQRHQMALAAYDGAVLMAGLTPEGHASLLMSYDNGRCWTDTIATTPAALKATEAPTVKQIALTTDDTHFIWLYTDGTLWRGRINRLGWDNEKFIFLRARRK